jgi:hypothetical protein
MEEFRKQKIFVCVCVCVCVCAENKPQQIYFDKERLDKQMEFWKPRLTLSWKANSTFFIPTAVDKFGENWRLTQKGKNLSFTMKSSGDHVMV